MRGDQVVRELELICILADGRPRSLKDLEWFRIEEGISEKTLRRDLQHISRVKRLCVEVKRYNGGIVQYKVTAGIVQRKYVPKFSKCTKCKETKLTEGNFTTDRARKTGVRAWCNACHTKIQRIWRKKNRRKNRRMHRNYEARKRKELELESRK